MAGWLPEDVLAEGPDGEDGGAGDGDWEDEVIDPVAEKAEDEYGEEQSEAEEVKTSEVEEYEFALGFFRGEK